MVLPLIMHSGDAQRIKGLGRPLTTGRALGGSYKSYNVSPSNATDLLCDTVLHPSRVQCLHL